MTAEPAGGNMRARRPVVFAGLALTGLIACLAAGLVCLDRWFPLDIGHRPVSTVVTARDGTPLRAFADAAGVWRYPVMPEEVSPLYLSALITYEDRWFYHHPGVNPLAAMRACLQNLSGGRIVSGGSTLTMQVARILFQEGGRGKWATKIVQMARALQLEAHLTKREILGLYLTHAPFGGNIEGVWAASRIWLGKDPGELTHAEAALLAVLPQAPSYLRPDRHAARARKARDKVLDRMERFRVWTGEIVDAAKQEPVVAFRFRQPVAAPLASRRLFNETPGRPRIRSCLDFELQAHMAALVQDYMNTLPPDQSCAVLVADHQRLGIRAYVGSADFFSRKRHGHVDMVRATRSPGSALKPFLYGMAMDAGLIHSHSLLLDVPRFGATYMPGNFTGGFTGPVSVATALQQSLNVPAVQVLEAFGPQTFHDRLRNGGARLRLSGKPNLSMVLGGVGTNLESLVSLYTALARGGHSGRLRLAESDPVRERYLMSPGAAYIVLQLLRRPMPGQEGLSRLAGFHPVAWKTGTSYGFRDAWAVGLLGRFVAGVWIGRPDGTPSPGQYGAVTAIPLLRMVLESLPRDDFRVEQPDSVTRKHICWPLGLSEDQTNGPCTVRHEAWILDGRIPLTRGLWSDESLQQTFWLDENGFRATPDCGGIRRTTVDLWPGSAEPWLPAAWRRHRLIPPVSPGCPDQAPMAGHPIRIVSVSDNSTLTRTPGQETPPLIPLEVLGGQGRLYWFLNQVPLTGTEGLPMPGPGFYELAVLDETGASDRIRFRVIKTGG